MTRASSSTPLEVTTFLEDVSQTMTEDWFKSLLYKNIRSQTQTKLPLTEQEITIIARKPPRESKLIQSAIEKGIFIIKSLLMEMLGTKEDMNRFIERYMILSPAHVRAIMEKCLDLISVKKITSEILSDIIVRDKIIKNLETSNNRIKEKVLKVYRLNKSIREKICEWTKNESVPFENFIFKGKNYLQTICEDSILLQGYLASPSVLYTQMQ